MIFLFHISRRACLKEWYISNWHLAVLAKFLHTFRLIEQARPFGALKVPVRVSCWLECALHCAGLEAQCTDTNQTPDHHSCPFRHYLPVAESPSFSFCVMFSDFIFKLIKGNCENNVLLTEIETHTEMAILMSCDLSLTAYTFNICRQ